MNPMLVLPLCYQNIINKTDDKKGDYDNSGTFSAKDVRSKYMSANQSLPQYCGKITFHLISVIHGHSLN